jgi:hypothetical protein
MMPRDDETNPKPEERKNLSKNAAPITSIASIKRSS